MMKKRPIILLLLAALLSSCGSGVTETAETTGADTAINETGEAETASRWLDDLPEGLDFGGETVSIHSFSPYEIGIESETGDILNDTTYIRDRDIEERLNVDLAVQVSGGWQTYDTDMAQFRSSIAAGDNAWQIIAGWGLHSSLLALENCFLNLNEVEHLDLSKPWWNQNAVEGCDILGKIYYATGDISFYTLIGDSYVMFVNNTLCNDFGIPSIPDLVREGTWTIDKMKELCEDIMVDLNGDTIMDENDQYGYVTDLWNSTDSFYTSADIHQILKEDGLPVYVSQEERITTLMEKIYPLYYGKDIGSFYTPDAALQVNMFKEGRAMIIPRELTTSMSDFREMDDEFTIVPFPKLDEMQENYRTSAHNGASLWSIPSDNPNPALAGAVLEALAAESSNKIIPTYFETCLQDKFARNEETIEMLNLIRDTMFLDMEMLMHKSFNSPLYVIAHQISAEQNNVASYMAANISKYEAAVENVIATIREMK